jgi:dihydroxyacetone kinase-like protein
MLETVKYIESIANEIISNEANINQLDANLGDGDCGSNIARGFKAVLTQVPSFTKDTPLSKDMLVCAQQIMSKIGGSSGPLFGGMFMALASVFKDKTNITKQDVVDGLTKAIDKITQLGKTHLGEKTLLDALVPAIEALKQSNTLDFKAAAEAAQKGAEATTQMVATKGRASYLGERSIGHMDAGS